MINVNSTHLKNVLDLCMSLLLWHIIPILHDDTLRFFFNFFKTYFVKFLSFRIFALDLVDIGVLELLPFLITDAQLTAFSLFFAMVDGRLEVLETIIRLAWSRRGGCLWAMLSHVTFDCGCSLHFKLELINIL